MARAEVKLFLSHVCDDHVLVRDVRTLVHRNNDRGAHPIIRLVFGCPDLSGSPGGTSISETWKDRMEAASGVVFLWTKDAPHSVGTVREWEYNRDHAHKTFCMAAERDAILPKDADPDVRRISLPVLWRVPPGAPAIPSLLRPRPPKCRCLPLFGPARNTLSHEIWSFARILLVPLV
jgi:hypothetical protein